MGVAREVPSRVTFDVLVNDDSFGNLQFTDVTTTGTQAMMDSTTTTTTGDTTRESTSGMITTVMEEENESLEKLEEGKSTELSSNTSAAGTAAAAADGGCDNSTIPTKDGTPSSDNLAVFRAPTLTLYSGRRGEYCSATVIKLTRDAKLGIQLRQGAHRGDLRISFLRETGSLFESPLRVGDKVVSINGKACFDMEPSEAVQLLQDCIGYITIVVHYSGGDSNKVETMVEKPNARTPVGLGIRRSRSEGGVLEICKLSLHSIFGHSLLNVGDRVLAINGMKTDGMDPNQAIHFIRNTAKYVTLITETTHESFGVDLDAASVGVGGTATTANRAEAVAAVTTAVSSENPFADFTAEDKILRTRQHACCCMWMMVLTFLIVSAVVVSQRDS